MTDEFTVVHAGGFTVVYAGGFTVSRFPSFLDFEI